jgi:multidrug transporter EmrE-like cation transporter
LLQSSSNLHARTHQQLIEDGVDQASGEQDLAAMGKVKERDGESMSLPRTIARETKYDSRKDFLFKAYVIVSMTFLWTAYTLTVRYTRSTTPADQMYSAPTVVLLAELTKWLIAIGCFVRSYNYDLREARRILDVEFFGRPIEMLKMSVPSIAYALQNNLDFVALSNLDAGVYQVTTQLKVVTTAVFMVVMLRRRYSPRRWFAITLLFCGVAAVQMDAVGSAEDSADNVGKQSYALGLIAVLSTCVTAGFAGRYLVVSFVCRLEHCRRVLRKNAEGRRFDAFLGPQPANVHVRHHQCGAGVFGQGWRDHPPSRILPWLRL